MRIDEELIKKVAKNARLELTSDEIAKFLPQFEELISFFSQLDEVDVSQTASSFQPIEIKNVWREDEPTESLSQEDALSQTSQKKDGYFKGPRSI